MEVKALFKLFEPGYYGWVEGMPEVGARGATPEECRENLRQDIRQAARLEREGKACGLGGFADSRSYTFAAIMTEEFTEKALENAGEVIRETLSIPDL